jgi:hypothetical protein
MRLILFSFIITILVSCTAVAEVSLKLDGYNSEDFMSMDLIGQNLNFGGMLYVDTQNLIYKNGGSSNDPNGFYAFDISFNDDAYHSSSYIEKGSFSWTAEAKSTDFAYPNAYPDGFFILNANNNVRDYDNDDKDHGTLISSYGNSNVNVENYVKTFDAGYSESIGISQESVQAKGGGSTFSMDASVPQKPEQESVGPFVDEDFISMSDSYTHVERGPSTNSDGTYQSPDRTYTDSPTSSPNAATQTEDGNGFIQKMRVDGINDWAQINADILGDLSTSWKCGVDAKASDIAFGLNVDGISKDALQNFHMEAEGSDIPQQFLPPGSIKINFKTATELELEQYSQYAITEKEAFYDEYPTGTSDQPWTWYYTIQDVFVEKSPQDDNSPNPTEDTAGTPELFQMMMKFYIEDNQ